MPAHGHISVERIVKTSIHQLCADTGCHLENLSRAMADRNGWQKRVKGISAVGMSFWWWMKSCKDKWFYYCYYSFWLVYSFLIIVAVYCNLLLSRLIISMTARKGVHLKKMRKNKDMWDSRSHFFLHWGNQSLYASCFTNLMRAYVIFWPSTEPSIKRCTCVNKWKNSGSRWALDGNITRCQTVRVSWRQDAELRASGRQRALGPQ